MSDRIDELVETVRGGYPWQDYPAKSESYIALTELATIAREAEARALKAEAEVERLSHLEAAALPLWNHIGCAGCGNSPKAECAAHYSRFVDELYRAAMHYNETASEAVAQK